MNNIFDYSNNAVIPFSAALHEIRNPLTLIYSTLQIIETEHPEVSGFAHWTEVFHDLDYLSQLLNDLSAFSHCTTLHKTSVNSTSFFRSIALSYAASLSQCEIEFRSSIRSSLPPLFCDKTKLEQLILNLLINAKDAVAEVNAPKISMDIFVISDQMNISISDNGCGLSKEQQKNIFTPLVTYKKNGTGLGLAIAKSIADAHGGLLTVSSKINCGSTFTLSLPIEQNAQ